MSLSGVDWLLLWKYDRPFFFWAYAFFSVLIRIWIARRVMSSTWITGWLVGSVTSLLIFPLMPFLSIPAYLIVMPLTGRTVSESFFMDVPIAVSIAGCITVLDATLVRLLSRNAMRKKEVWLFFRANFLIVGLAIVAVMTVELIHPVEVIAETRAFIATSNVFFPIWNSKASV